MSEPENEEACEPAEEEMLPEQPDSRPRRSAATQARDHILAKAMSECLGRNTDTLRLVNINFIKH